MATDIIGKALLDYQSGNFTEDIKTFSSLDEEDVMPLAYLFRNFDQMPIIEQTALNWCKGSILDIGCGAGSHSLYLQQQNMEVTALDSSEGAIATCQARGVQRVSHSEINSYSATTYDTLLLLMNGIGLAGTVKHLGDFLEHLKSLLRPNGQILLDSSDIIYMFEQDQDGGYFVSGETQYYGEITFKMTYKGESSEYFNWLYLDFQTLLKEAQNHNLNCEMICKGAHYDYLARLTLK